MANRNSAETSVPMTPPTFLNGSKWLEITLVVAATPATARATTVEWPRAKNRPTQSGRLPSCISLRVTLSMAAMWSASTAWRRPKP